MVRRTKEEAAETRDQLLDAAERVFRSRGVGHTTLAEVADAAGVTRGAIYWHFKDKSDLFEALVERAELPIDAALEAMGSEPLTDPLAALRELSLVAIRNLACNPRTQAVFDIVFLRCEYTEELAAVGKRHLEERRECLSKCEMALAQAVKLGQLPADTDTRLAAHGLYAFVGGIMRDWIQSPKSYDLEVAAPAFIDLYLAGLKANPPRLGSKAAAAEGQVSKRQARISSTCKAPATAPVVAKRAARA
jgi:TetR/AcrR family transcriptional regulator, acrAB operon repressor